MASLFFSILREGRRVQGMGAIHESPHLAQDSALSFGGSGFAAWSCGAGGGGCAGGLGDGVW
jgi:hypothetical protein